MSVHPAGTSDTATVTQTEETAPVVGVNVDGSPPGSEPKKEATYLDSYKNSFCPFWSIMKSPLGYWSKSGKAWTSLFSCFHEEEDVNMRAVYTWLVIKFYCGVTRSIFMLVFVVVISGQGAGVANFVLGIIIAFFTSHLLWWLMDSGLSKVCCKGSDILVISIILLFFAFLNLVFILMDLTWWSLFPLYILVDVATIPGVVCGSYAGGILLQQYLKNQKVQPSADNVIEVNKAVDSPQDVECGEKPIEKSDYEATPANSPSETEKQLYPVG